MLRSEHFWYDLRKLLGSARVLLPVLALAGVFIFFLSFQFVYVFALLLTAIFAGRGLIGRRCPHCDGSLKEIGAERDKENSFVMHIIWGCPKDGYRESERTKGDSGLFGVG